jgi:N-formylglutamate amidohydrolase
VPPASPADEPERIDPADVGLPAGERLPFRFGPAATITPVVLSFPHVGLAWPHELRPKPQLDYAGHADFRVHVLYRDAFRLGIATLESLFSRTLVDLNRAPHDRDPAAVQGGELAADGNGPSAGGRGVIWATSLQGARLLPRPLTPEEADQRIARYYLPYHRALALLLARRRQRFGYAVLLDAHSMPGTVPADLLLGTRDGTTCSAQLADRALAALSDAGAAEPGLVVRRDSIYRGGEIVRSLAAPADGVHALQLEVRRSLYMDEGTARLLPDLEASVGLTGGRIPARPGRSTTQGAAIAALRLASLQRRVRCLLEALVAPAQDLSREVPLGPPAGSGPGRAFTPRA